MKVCIFIIFYILSTCSVVAKEEKNYVDSITAIVNDQIILKSDVDDLLLLLKKEGKDIEIPFKSTFLKEKIIKKLIINSLILQEANRMNITVTKEQIDAVIKNIAMKKNTSVDELKNDIIDHNIDNNFTYNDYINHITNLIKMKMIEDYELHKRIKISEEEVNLLSKKLIEKNKNIQKINLSYILLPIFKKNTYNSIEKQKKIAVNIANQLKSGYDFEKLYADFKKTKNFLLIKRMFWMSRLDIQNSFSKNLDISEKGQIIGPVIGEKGFYILKVNDIKSNKKDIVTEFYIQHCLIKPSTVLNDVESKKRIFSIYDNIKKGIYSFDYAAKNLSHDFYSADKNGNLGWISKEFFDIKYGEELLHLNKNEISKPIKSNFGWHIIKLLDKRQVDKIYNLQKKEAYNILLKRNISLEKNNWIKELQKNAYIKIIRA